MTNGSQSQFYVIDLPLSGYLHQISFKIMVLYFNVGKTSIFFTTFSSFRDKQIGISIGYLRKRSSFP